MMKQTLYEKIKIIVESWNIAITQDKDWNHMLRSSLNKHWWMRSSFPSRSLENCYYDLWYQNHDMSEIEKREWQLKYIWIYERPLRRPKVGQKVQIIYWEDEGNFWKVIHDVDWLYCMVEVLHKLDDLAYYPRESAVPYDCIAPRVSPDE